MTTTETVNQIRRHHRRRRFAMKIQQKLDRSLESFIRINATKWSPSASEADREKINREVAAIIKELRAQIKEGQHPELSEFVIASDEARKPADKMRDASETQMEKLAEKLPVYQWIESVKGAGALGLATIVAESGDLSGYAKPTQLWKRLGYAPYDGHAGSTWKRDKWRPRALTKEEWIDNPFSGERYALMHQLSTWLVNAQWIGKAKTGTDEGEPNGPYGEVYAARRKHTLTTHPEWTPGHRRNDALRFAFKRFLKELLAEWRSFEAQAREEEEEEQPKRKRRAVGAKRKAA